MAIETAVRDPNRNISIQGVDSIGFNTPTNIAVNPSTHAMLVQASITLSGTTDVNLTQVGGASFALGQQLATSSLPVVLTAAQITTLTPLSTIAVTQSTSPWIVSGAVTNAGTFAVQATEADGANVTLGAKTDAKSTATDSTSITAMQVLKQISASVQAPPSQAVTGTFFQSTQPVSLASAQVASGAFASGAIASGAIASGAVASGAFASGAIAAGAIAAGASSLVKLEDVASADADAGVPAMAILKATPADTAGTDGDYQMLQMSGGRLWVDASGKTLTVGSHAVTNAGTFAVQSTEISPTTVFNGKTTVTTAGTRVALAGSTTVKSVTIKALKANTGTIYVGNATVANTNGFALSAGDTISMDLADLATVNIDSSVNGEGVTYLAVT